MDARTEHIERVVHDYVLGFHKKDPDKALSMAYRKVFLEALQSVPEEKRPKDIYLLSVMVRWCEYAAMALYIEHTSDELVKFKEPANSDVYNWLIEIRRFLNSLREHWDEIPPPLFDASDRRQTIDEHATLLDAIVEDVGRRLHEQDSDDEGVLLPAVWFKQIKEFGIALMGFWLDAESVEALERCLEEDSELLLQYRFLDSAPHTGYSDV